MERDVRKTTRETQFGHCALSAEDWAVVTDTFVSLEGFVDAEPMPNDPTAFRGVIRRMERSGELFLYVNEAVIPLPWLSDLFYRNNKGSAQVVIERLS
jgi:hypothetical protein